MSGRKRRIVAERKKKYKKHNLKKMNRKSREKEASEQIIVERNGVYDTKTLRS